MNHIRCLTFGKEWLASLYFIFGLISQNNPALHVKEDILCIKLLSILLILRKQRLCWQPVRKSHPGGQREAPNSSSNRSLPAAINRLESIKNLVHLSGNSVSLFIHILLQLVEVYGLGALNCVLDHGPYIHFSEKNCVRADLVHNKFVPRSNAHPAPYLIGQNHSAFFINFGKRHGTLFPLIPLVGSLHINIAITNWDQLKYRGMYKDLYGGCQKRERSFERRMDKRMKNDGEMVESPTVRFWEVDLLRGVAIVLMVLYHLVFDLNYFAVYDIDVSSGFWLAVARAAASLFLLLVGLSLTLSHSRARLLGAGRSVSPPAFKAERLDIGPGPGRNRRHLSLHRQRLHRIRSAAPHRPLAAAGLSFSSAAKSELHFRIIIYIIRNIFAEHQRRLSLAALAGAGAAGFLFGGLLSRLSLVRGDSGGDGPGQPALSRLPAQDSGARSFSVIFCEGAGIPGTKLAGHLSGPSTDNDCDHVSSWGSNAPALRRR